MATTGGEVSLTPRQPPPAGYYADNLLKVVGVVRAMYDDMLTDAERAWGETLAAATGGAQRLFARIVSRKGPLLRIDSLRYAEVPDAGRALDELCAAGLVQRCPEAPADMVLGLLARREIDAVFPHARLPGAGASKAEQVRFVAARYPERESRRRIAARLPWVRIRAPELLRLYRLLFFGDAYQDLTAFVLRDLGMHRYADMPLSPETRQFADRAALERYLRLTDVAACVHGLGPRPDAASARPLIDELWHPEGGRPLERKRSRLLNHLGRGLERAGHFDAALTCYARASLPPARERSARILRRLGDAGGVEEIRASILRAPGSALERDFARRFGRRPGRSAPYFDVPLPPPGDSVNGDAAVSIERRALALLTAGGGVGWHLENDLPMGLFALAYWDWIFAPVPGAFTNPFQTGPVDLFWPDFFEARRGRCDDPMRAGLKARMLAAYRAHEGIANRLFGWRRFTLDALASVLGAMTETDLEALLGIVVADLDQARSGFPDLTVIRGGRCQFVEVKGPGDRLQINQHLWIDALERRGLPVRVMRLTAP